MHYFLEIMLLSFFIQIRYLKRVNGNGVTEGVRCVRTYRPREGK